MKKNLYDEYYFAHGCGQAYERNDHWLGFFDKIGQRIMDDVAPKSMLDAGCAMGFLVEAMRKRDVEAYGIDISDYAISQAHKDIQPHVRVGSITEPFPRKYDLIVTIEVLEHLEKDLSEKALANLCKHTDDIIFSSTPLDYKEATHFNVQPPEYWAELFAREGFYRDVDFDASFITPWAARFRRGQEPTHKVVRDYERKYWFLWKENTDLRSLVGDMRNQLVEDENAIRAQSTEHDKIVNALNRRIQDYKNFWAEMEQTTGWQLLHRYRLWQTRIAPPGSARARSIRNVISGLRTLQAEGPVSFVRKTSRRVFSRGGPKLSPEEAARRNADAYQKWIAVHALTEEDLTAQRAAAAKLKHKPTISIVTPVYNPPERVLREMIDSLIAQTYWEWELCLANGGDDPNVRQILTEYMRKDDRVRVKHLDENLGISGNTNIALEMATGDFILPGDHDDVYTPNALFEVAKRLNEKPGTDVVYFDEDKLSEDSAARSSPFFKPDWSPEMLLSANYLTHAVWRKSLVEKVGGFNPDTDGAQDWDLAFRCTEITTRIEHIPHVLYHWRELAGSTAGAAEAKTWVFENQAKSVARHLQRCGVTEAQAYFPDKAFPYPRAVWPTASPKVSVVIPNKDKVYYLRKCILSLTRLTDYENLEIIIVDSGSTQKETLKYYETLKEKPNIKFVDFTGSFNYSAANNLGAKHADGEILLFLNNDTEAINADWLEEMVRWAERPDIGVVGAKLMYPDMTVQHAGVVIGMEGHASHVFWGAEDRQGGPFGSVDWYRNFSAITGACMMIPRAVFEEVGGFDEDYVLAFSDIELCLRIIEHGYRVMYTPHAKLKHYEGKSRGDHIPVNDIQLGYKQFIEKVTAGDPYFNPNLSYTHRMPTIANPGEEDRVARLNRILTIHN